MSTLLTHECPMGTCLKLPMKRHGGHSGFRETGSSAKGGDKCLQPHRIDTSPPSKKYFISLFLLSIRSFARRIQESLNDYCTPCIGSQPSSPARQLGTILDMHFSEEDDEDQSIELQDPDYNPEDLLSELQLLRRDRALDVSSSTSSASDDSSHPLSAAQDESSNQSAVTSQLLCPEDPSLTADWSCADENRTSPYHTRSHHQQQQQPQSPRVERGSSDHHQSPLATAPDSLSGQQAAAAVTDVDELTDDVDEQVYADFLRSLFASASNSPSVSPCKKVRLPPNH